LKVRNALRAMKGLVSGTKGQVLNRHVSMDGTR
jgi:hypothetical protein